MKSARDLKGKIVIYRAEDGRVNLDVTMDSDNIWLSQAQLSLLFNTERSSVTKHLKRIFQDHELAEKGNVQKMHIPNSDKPTKFYSLDAIISVGYRINSRRATQFRIWATRTLKDHIVRGYTVNEKRLRGNQALSLKELEKTVNILQKVIKHKRLAGSETEGLLQVIADYANAWVILQKYDDKSLSVLKDGKIVETLDYDFAKAEIETLKSKLVKDRQASDFFGREREGGLGSIIKNLGQSFGGRSLYPTIAERASHLLYFVIKDHPFTDGNKRIASLLFILFLLKNNYLFNKKGEKKINDNALAALALLIAASHPKEKEVMVALVTNLLVDLASQKEKATDADRTA